MSDATDSSKKKRRVESSDDGRNENALKADVDSEPSVLVQVPTGLEEIGKALDAHMATLPADKRNAMESVLYSLLHAAHSYIFLELDEYGSSEIEDKPALEKLKTALRDGNTKTYMNTLFGTIGLDF